MLNFFRVNILLSHLNHYLPTSFRILLIDIVKLDFWELTEVLDRLFESIED